MWPGQRSKPASFQDSLQMGAVTMASIFLLAAAVMASRTNCMEAWPPARVGRFGAEDGEFVVVEYDDIVVVGGRVAVGEAFVLVAPPEGFDLGEVGGVGEEFVEAEDDEAGEFADFGVGEGFDDDFGADAAGVAHGDADGGAGVGHASPRGWS